MVIRQCINASGCEILTYNPVQNYTCNRNEGIEDLGESVQKTKPYMTTILVQNRWKLSVKSPNYRPQGVLIITITFKGNRVVDDET